MIIAPEQAEMAVDKHVDSTITKGCKPSNYSD